MNKSFTMYIYNIFIVLLVAIRAYKRKNTSKYDKNNFVLFRLDEIGDVVLTTPFLRELKKNYPEAKITLIVKPQVYNLVELCPYVDEILTFKRIEGRFKFFHNIYKAYKFAKKYLRGEEFDLAIIPRWDADYYYASFIAFFSQAKERIAFSEKVTEYKSQSNKGYDALFTKVYDYRDLCHEVEKNLYLLKQLGGAITDDSLELWNDTEDEKYIDCILKNYEKEYLIALVVSASGNKREWPPEKFSDLMTIIVKDNKNVRFVLLGDKTNTEKIKNKIVNNFLANYVIDCVGETTLRQTYTILKRCKFFIGLDTGPMHIAAVTKVYGIVLSCHPQNGEKQHGNAPERFGPWKSNLKVIRPLNGLGACKDSCIKNYAHCINQITVEQVFEEYKKITERKVVK